MSRQIPNGATEPLTVVALDSTGALLTGLVDVTTIIRRYSDDEYWDNAAFQTTSTDLAMTEVSAAEAPGQYDYDYVTAGLPDGQYYIVANSPTAANSPWEGFLEVADFSVDVNKINSVIIVGNGSTVPFNV